MLTVEPGWLGAGHQGQQDQSDAAMIKIIRLANNNDGNFCFCEVHGLKLCYRTPRPNVCQLVVLWSGGLHQLLLQELHNASYAVPLGERKTTSVLLERVWWPNLAVNIKKFVAGC